MKRVLVAPLDWGLGHATRCIPIIKKFQARGCEVLIGGSGESLELLKKEFPALKTIILPAYAPEYPASGSMVWKMIKQLPKFIRVIDDEQQVIREIIVNQKLDLVVSDNRYGLWSSQIPTIFITHQSNIMMPKRFGWLQSVVRSFNHRQMKKFSVCWIPDFPGSDTLAGELINFGSTPKVKTEFIGALSRFRNQERETQYDVLAILSGPEPQRTILEKLIVSQVRQSGLNYFIVLGQISSRNSYNDPCIVDYLTTEALQEKILSAGIVISRSGYSSVMDLAALGKKSIFIPTPGQTEQEYLAKTLKEKRIAYSMDQGSFNLKTALDESRLYEGFAGFDTSDELLEKAIQKILSFGEPHLQHTNSFKP